MTEIRGPGIRVVVAEDQPIVADGIAAVLTEAGDMEVVGLARNGEEAIELLRKCQPDVILLDIRMPVLDGIGVARWIKKSGSKVRTVILTVIRNANEMEEAIRAGANAYLLKDAPVDEILRTIRSVHHGKAPVSAKPGKAAAGSVNSGDLKPLELEILTLIVQGHDNRTIGTRLGLSLGNVKSLLRSLYSKLGVGRRAAAARQAMERGLFRTV